MVAILGANFHERKLVKVCIAECRVLTICAKQKALESFYGLGPQASLRIMAKYTIHPSARLESIPAKTVTALTAELSNMTIENDARRIVQENIKRLRDMGTYRGRRHAMGLPVRGQKTRTQIETAKKLNTLERGGTGSRY
ncbi:40S ribosomal protein s13 [Xylaria arbuscula]|nr:40S ribosomal protein s13 [Xylaria arbuscula]